jgi:hypothetical protein
MSNCLQGRKIDMEQEYRPPPVELVRLIRKLRWIGMDEEAEELHAKMQEAGVIGGVLTVPSETD